MPDDDVLPRMLSERYRLEAVLGHGGMGVVYRGSDLTMQRPIAVKLVRALDGVELDDEIAGRFLREAKNTARLQHEHIIEVFDLGRAKDGSLYFVMELLEGESLSARLRREGKLSPAIAAHIGRQICEALYVAHTAGVVHRDLKPANVMLLSRAGDDDYVKVLDFGVAKSLLSNQETQFTHTGMLVGTVDYMAPEQITGEAVDGRTDIYALGVVLYKMLSGHAPFLDTGVPALIHAHLNTMPKPLTEVTTGVPNGLDHVVLRCLAKKPGRRYESMAEVARALAAAVMPDVRLLDFAYDDTSDADADPYADGGVKTEVRPFDIEQELANGEGDVSDDATIRIDRPFSLRDERAGRIAPSDGAPVPGAGRGATTPPMPRVHREDVSTAKRAVPDAVWQFERSGPKKTCAMCQTRNPPHVRVCAACGVSLELEEQDAVRARVRSEAPSSVAPASGTGVGMPPSASGSRSMAGGAGPASVDYAAPPSMPWLPQPPPSPAPPPSTWQRFLAWVGLRR